MSGALETRKALQCQSMAFLEALREARDGLLRDREAILHKIAGLDLAISIIEQEAPPDDDGSA